MLGLQVCATKYWFCSFQILPAITSFLRNYFAMSANYLRYFPRFLYLASKFWSPHFCPKKWIKKKTYELLQKDIKIISLGPSSLETCLIYSPKQSLLIYKIFDQHRTHCPWLSEGMMSPLPTACRFLMVSHITDLYRFSWDGFSKLHSSRVKFTATSKVTDSYKSHMCSGGRMRWTTPGV
jgi:hypothetical protein